VACEICDDTTWKTITVDGISRVTRCDCFVEKSMRSRLSGARIPTRYHHCTIENVEAYNESLKRAAKYAQRVVDEFPVATRTGTGRDAGLLLMGLPGVGKTHLAVAILKQCIYKGGVGLFYVMGDLMADLRGTYAAGAETTESELLRRVSEADVVVFDDLGRERATDWRDEMLHIIINARYSHRRPTIFTTNYDVADIDDPDALQVRVGMRVYSRLHEMCELMHLDGADYRERPTNAGVEDLISMWKMRRKGALPTPKASGRQMRVQLRDKDREGKGDLKWPGGRAGSR
jgi:DNA replication protein DnaC